MTYCSVIEYGCQNEQQSHPSYVSVHSCMQLIHDDPNGSSSIAQLNKSKNRYLNTNTCEF